MAALFYLLCATTVFAVSVSSQCVDIRPDCAAWVREQDFCNNPKWSPQYRKQTCPMTCGLCGRFRRSVDESSMDESSNDCHDTSDKCENWVKQNFCTSTFYSTQQKTELCAKSCNLCAST